MKKVLKIVSLVLAITCLLVVAIVPASATTNGKWNTAYSLINSNGSVASSDTYYIYSNNAWTSKTVYIKKSIHNCVLTKSMKDFYNNVKFDVNIYKIENNKYKKVSTQTVTIGGNFKMPKTAISTKYKVVISKRIPRKNAVAVRAYSYTLNYCISTKK